MHFESFVALVCGVVAVAAQISTDNEELTPRTKAQLPQKYVRLPPGVGLCLKNMPDNQCSIRSGGGRGSTEVASDTIVKKLERRGFVKTKLLPRHINSFHLCCKGKKFGMEIELGDPRHEKPIKFPQRKVTVHEPWKYEGMPEGEKGEEPMPTPEREAKPSELVNILKANASLSNETEITGREKNATTTATKITFPEHTERRKKHAEREKKRTHENRLKVEPLKVPRNESDAVETPESKESSAKTPHLPSWLRQM